MSVSMSHKNTNIEKLTQIIFLAQIWVKFLKFFRTFINFIDNKWYMRIEK